MEGGPCKPVSRVLCPPKRMVAIYLARPLAPRARELPR